MMNLMNRLEMKSLKSTLKLDSYNAKQKKAIKNMKNCADYQWAWVNTYIDGDESIRPILLDAKTTFYTVYEDSQKDIYEEGAIYSAQESYLKDIRFCGKEFLQTVALYYTAKLMQDIFSEVDATEEEQQVVLDTLMKLKDQIAGKSSSINHRDLQRVFSAKDGNESISELGRMMNIEVKRTKKSENWFYLNEEDATQLKEFFINNGYEIEEKKSQTKVSTANANFIIKSGKKAYIWCLA